MVAKMTKRGLFSYLRAYLTHITPYKLFTRLFFVKNKNSLYIYIRMYNEFLVIYIGSFDTPSYYDWIECSKHEGIGEWLYLQLFA